MSEKESHAFNHREREVPRAASVSNRVGAGGSPLGETTAPPPGILERLPGDA